jgi:TonB family protein
MSQRNERSGQLVLNGLTHWLIHQAAHRAPASLSSRLEEEWLADLESRSAALPRLRFAVGCLWAGMVIVHDHPRDRVAAAASAAATTTASIALTDRDFGYLSLRSATLFLIAGLHAAILYGLITALPHTHGVATPPNLQNQVVDPVPPTKLAPPVAPALDLKHWTIEVQKLVENVPPKIDVEREVTTGVVETPQPFSPPLPPATPPHVVQTIAGGPGAGFPDTADFYPSLSMHLGEQGISTVRVCVDPKGKLASDPAIEHSSGVARLDQGALRLARAGSGHYRATTEDGRPVTSCYPVGIRFQLKN